MDSWYIGTDLKFLITMSAPGFSMDEDEWEIIVKCGNSTVGTFNKTDCVRDDDGNWYVCVPYSIIRKGDLSIVGHALVPDADFVDTGIRNEVDKIMVGRIKKV